ncbi:MAG TPA: tRNA pseudouridine(38-40) synthase TruA [Acidimicrobiales bacterium]|jgi:tRNA pseudouridine38-40 synthase|nr:tRNA pseudouridine(38-40) synthase TruA [Acidimicrobiales bacterium]
MVSLPQEGMKRYKAFVTYDGTPFHGFAPNPDVETVGGKIRDSLEKVLGKETNITCAGRTDAGVHAEGQVISFNAGPIDEKQLERSLNQLCSPHIGIRSLEETDPTFDARFSAKSRTYRYQILNQDYPDPFLQRFVWHVHDHLDTDSMQTASTMLIGEHDFSSFCRKRIVKIDGLKTEASLTREIHSIEVTKKESNIIEIWITASSFCHQMVRSITGTLVDVGLGKTESYTITSILAEKNRNAAGRVAPPQGLTLMKVKY